MHDRFLIRHDQNRFFPPRQSTANHPQSTSSQSLQSSHPSKHPTFRYDQQTIHQKQGNTKHRSPVTQRPQAENRRPITIHIESNRTFQASSIITNSSPLSPTSNQYPYNLSQRSQRIRGQRQSPLTTSPYLSNLTTRKYQHSNEDTLLSKDNNCNLSQQWPQNST